MSNFRQFQTMGNQRGQYNDTAYTKIFVGGLAWETKRDTMRRYFEQFGEILEAVVIADKNTGRSKGYGFVTFKDPEAAIRACENPAPVIDGRRANCNLASLGATKSRLPSPLHGIGRVRPPPGLAALPAHHGSSPSHIHQPTGPYFPYSAYGYTGFSQDTIYPLNYYGVYGSQQFSPITLQGCFLISNYYPYYGQNSQSQSYSVHYPQMAQYPYLPQNYASTRILTRPSIPIPEF